MNGRRVLIVDDEAPLRFLLSKQLSRAGFETATAPDGATALESAAATPFDAIVLDVVMPGMDGFEVCRRLKADARTAELPVIFLSASSSGEFRRRAFSVGAADFLAKPFQIEQLPVYIEAILRRATEAAPAAGRVISVVGANTAADAAAVATRLAEKTALQGPGPVMLVDLELPAGSIGARLQLSGGPNVRVLLQNTGEPINDETIGRVAQRFHGALEVMPAPYSPSLISRGEPEPQRLTDMLDNLTGRGYCVVVHLGTRVTELAQIALARSEVVWTATKGRDMGELAETLAAAGVAHVKILPAVDGRLDTAEPAQAKPGRARKPRKQAEPLATALLPTA